MHQTGPRAATGRDYGPPRSQAEEMRRITIADLENSITEAQYTICVQQLRDLRCMCGGPKEYYKCFCRTCYFALPLEMRAPLWIEHTTVPDLERFVRGYLSARRFIREMGRAEL